MILTRLVPQKNQIIFRDFFAIWAKQQHLRNLLYDNGFGLVIPLQ